jgi:bifunctional non-homologous end joining protein LigD
MPLFKRSSLLRDSLRPSSRVSITDDFDDGISLFSLMKEKGWEGIVSKRKESPYLPGKGHNEWFKTKLSRKILAIVIGLTLKEGYPNSLVLAISGDEGLVIIGRASIGLTQEHFRLLKDNIPALKAKESPFGVKPVSREMRDVIWLTPRLTVWVSFLEWTSDGGLRHPKILGFSAEGPEKATGKEFVE